MFRFIGLICVFGIVAFFFASIFDTPSSIAQSPTCPCWDGSESPFYNTIDDAVSAITNSVPTLCDQVPVLSSDHAMLSAEIDGIYGYIIVTVTHDPTTHSLILSCSTKLNGQSPPIPPLTDKQFQACLQDILAYCRDYCMNSSNSQACS